MAEIEVYLSCLVPYIGHEHFNVLKNAFYIEKLVVGQVIISNKTVMTRKKNLITVILSISHDQIISEICNTGLQSVKVLMMIKT